MMSDTDWISQYIDLNPYRPGLDEARLKEFGVPVWALIGYLPAVGGAVNRVAADYELPVEAVEAAIAYYHQHRSLIDARVAANSVEGRAHLHAA
jgi:uncharacterized protein (DUF433 family)